MSLTAYPTLRLKLTMPQALKLQFLPAIPGSNAAAAAAAAEAAAAAAEDAANTAVAATANKVDRSGDVMTGFLTLNADPTALLHAATKQYVDAHAGGGSLSLSASQLAGRGSASGTGVPEAITLGTNLSMSGTTLNATGGGSGGGNVSNVGTPTNGQWARWTTATTIEGVAAASTGFVLKAGDTMTGDLAITKAAPALTLNKTAGAGNSNSIYGTVGGTSVRWQIIMGEGTAESGANAGSNLSFNRFSDTGVFLGIPIIIARATGIVTFEQSPAAPTPTAGDSSTKLATTAFVAAALAAAPTPTVQSFGSGSGTYTKPAGVKWLRVRVIGGGGGGSGSGTTSPNGSAGGATTFGGLTVPGGAGGSGLAGGAGGGAPTGVFGSPILAFVGTAGEAAVFGQVLHGGQGGSGFFGGHGIAGALSNFGGSATVAGSGGGGAGATFGSPTTSGGGGGGSGAYVETIIPTPAATYAYAIGAAGTGGVAGASGNVGGNGAGGIVLIEEYYV